MFSDEDQRMEDDNHTSLGTRYIVLLGANGFKRKTSGIELAKRGSGNLEVAFTKAVTFSRYPMIRLLR